jgi:hypothetical protein
LEAEERDYDGLGTERKLRIQISRYAEFQPGGAEIPALASDPVPAASRWTRVVIFSERSVAKASSRHRCLFPFPLLAPEGPPARSTENNR